MADDTVTQTGDKTDVTEATGAEKTDVMDTQPSGDITDNNTGEGEDKQGAEQETSDLAYDLTKIKTPDGVTVSDEDRAKFGEIVKGFGIKDQEGLQNFVDWVFKTSEENKKALEEQTKVQQEQSAKEWEEIKKGWETSLKSDADFGKDYDANIKRANDAIAKFGGSELSDWLKQTDFGNNPAIMKTFARIGKEIEDAKLVGGLQAKSGDRVQRDRYNQPMLKYKDM